MCKKCDKLKNGEKIQFYNKDFDENSMRVGKDCLDSNQNDINGTNHIIFLFSLFWILMILLQA